MTAPERPDIAVSRPVSASQAPEVPVEGSTVQDDWRAALAEAIRPAEPWPGAPRPEVITDALLPAVRRIVAAELRAAADDPAISHIAAVDGQPRAMYRVIAATDLYARADRLDATPDDGKA